MAKELSWEEAIMLVLREAGGMMRYTEIAEQIAGRALKKSANPAASVAATLSRCVREDGTEILKLGKGEYTLKSNIETTLPRVPLSAPDEEEDAPDAGALQAFGMYWQREHVVWSGRPRISGRQSLGASEVNFASQIGVYLLHDRDRIIYVGRATDTLFARLKFHTVDRLSGRWDRFSWFGLKSVRPDGSLCEPSAAWGYCPSSEHLAQLAV
jgi:hypothetical protein